MAGLDAVKPEVHTARPIGGIFAVILFLPAAVLAEFLGRALRTLPTLDRVLRAAPKAFYAGAGIALALLAVPLSHLSAVKTYYDSLPTWTVFIGTFGVLTGLALLMALRPRHGRWVAVALGLAVLVATFSSDY